MYNTIIPFIYRTRNARHELKEAADIIGRSFGQQGVLRELRNILGHARDYIAANGEPEF